MYFCLKWPGATDTVYEKERKSQIARINNLESGDFQKDLCDLGAQIPLKVWDLYF